MKEISEQSDFKIHQGWLWFASLLTLAALMQYPLLASTTGGSLGLSLVAAQLFFIPVILSSLAYGIFGGLLAATGASIAVIGAYLIGEENFDLIRGIAAYVIGYFTLALVIAIIKKSPKPKADPSQVILEKETEVSNQESIERLARTVANDLRNPLSAIRASLKIIEEGCSHDDLTPSLKALSKEVDRLDGIAEDYLDFAAPKVTHTNHVDISSMVESLVSQMRPQAERMGVRLALCNEKVDGFTRGDEERLSKLFINVLINGLQAAEGGGQVEVKCSHNKSVGSYVVEIIDTGPGIKDEVMDRIFEPFFSTRQRGSGLGLAIAKAIAVEHNGSISAANVPSSGARFTVELPFDDRIITEY